MDGMEYGRSDIADNNCLYINCENESQLSGRTKLLQNNYFIEIEYSKQYDPEHYAKMNAGKV